MLQEILNNMKKTIDLTYKLNFQMDNKYGDDLNNLNLVDSYLNYHSLYKEYQKCPEVLPNNMKNIYSLESAGEYISALLSGKRIGYEIKNGKKAYKVESKGKEATVFVENGAVPQINTAGKRFYYENGKPTATYFEKTGVYAEYIGKDVMYLKYDDKTDKFSTIKYSDYNPNGLNYKNINYNTNKLLQKEEVISMLDNKYPLENFKNNDDAMNYYNNYLSNINKQETNELFDSVNNILDNYSGKELDFEDLYGFRMYNVDTEGSVNFNDDLLVVHEFCNKN